MIEVDLSWVLETARVAGEADPAVDDYGPPIAAVCRHKAVLADTPVYSGPYARAAALTHTLGRLRWLERSNLKVALAVASGYLRACGITVKPTGDQVRALAEELRSEETTAARIAAGLRDWAAPADR